MVCQFCDKEAVSRCYSCGDLVCEQHQGRENCFRCETAIAAGDRRADRISAMPLANGGRPGWWRPIPAEDYDPPSCYQCKGLARLVCRNCQCRYCPEHGSKDGLCKDCERSSLIGLFVLGLLLVGVLALIVVQGFLSQ
jgi:hypothetical protein